MEKINRNVIAVLGLVIGLLITVFGWYLVGAFSDIIPIASLKAIYWIGAILLWVSCVLIIPLVIIMGGNAEYTGVIWGVGSFVLGYILSLLLYYTIGYTLDAMAEIWTVSQFTSIGWFMVYTLWILGLIIVPTGLALKNMVLK